MEMSVFKQKTSRREFIEKTGIGFAALTVMPRYINLSVQTTSNHFVHRSFSEGGVPQ
jgi:hypothetical protein